MRQIVWGVIAAGLMSSAASAAEPTPAPQRRAEVKAAAMGMAPALGATAVQAAPAPEPSPKVSVTGGVDMPSLYMFRGFRQESDPAFTIQPYVDVAIAGNDQASFNVGLWNSAHTGSNKDAGAGWYETDFYAAATVGMIKATYTAYTYPKIDNSMIHELMLSASFDHTLAPSVAIAFELAKPEGVDKGIYLELGVAPTLTPDDARATVTLPVKLGLSLKDYYGDDAFGYLSIGPSVVAPLSDHLDIHGNLTVYALGETTKFVNNDKRGQVTGTVGVGFSF
jgi:hypothetical protein